MTIPLIGNNLAVIRSSAIESWYELVWFRRILPLVVIGALWFGYTAWDEYATERDSQEQDKIALVTAQVWVATARFRNEPDKYLAYRDSLLTAAGLPLDAARDFVGEQEERPEELLPFVQKVQLLVDSLAAVEDSIARDTMTSAQDSSRQAVEVK